MKMKSFLPLKLMGTEQNLLRVLTYHRVAPVRDSDRFDPRLISTDPATFRRQMQHLANHYRVVRMEEVLNALERKVQLPKNAVLVTFDDAYFDLAEYAFPVLNQWQLPSTIFVPTSYPNQPERVFWWDRLYRALMHTTHPVLHLSRLGELPLRISEERRKSLQIVNKYLLTLAATESAATLDEICDQLESKPLAYKSVLDWDELRALAKAGVTLAAHTRTHPLLTRVSPEQARAEIVGSRQDLQREIGSALPVFCYPNGHHNDTVVNILKQAGFVAALTTLSGQNDLNTMDPLRLQRQAIYKKTSLPVFRLRLLRVGAYLDVWRLRKERRQHL